MQSTPQDTTPVAHSADAARTPGRTRGWNESGQTLVVMALIMSILALGFLAFAVDAGMLFREKRMAQAAADAAAVAAASELVAGATSNEQNAANAIAKLNGFDTTLAHNPATVVLAAPSTGTFTGSSYVQATVSKPFPTTFLAAFSSGFATMSVSAQAIAGGTGSQTCVCLEGGTGQNLYLYGGAKLSAPGCGVVANSSSSNAVSIVGATLDAQSLGTVSSSWDNNSNINNGGTITSSTLIVQGLTSTCAPTMPTPPTYSTCLGDPGGGSSNFTAGPSSASGVICYTSLTVGSNNTADTLNPGTYVIKNGYLTFNSGTGGKSNLGGNGVFFYLVGTAALQVANGANVNLVAGGSTESLGATAPTVGAYNGILLYQATGDASALTFAGGASTYANGSIYAPSAAVTLDNGSASSVTGEVVANSLTMYGGAILNATPSVSLGSVAISSPKLVQ